jgi:endonuclease/exonuclease/phosphatase family metal-dependent hydrolase
MRRLTIGAITLFLATATTPAHPAAGRSPEEAVVLRVMTFNIWYGATRTHGLDQVVEAIELAGADVVGLQEPYARLRRVARELGFHASPRMHLISRYPILEPQGSDGRWAYLLLAPGRVVAIANTHLPCCPYTPYRIVNRDLPRPEALGQEQRTRLRAISEQLAALEPLIRQEIPTFFTGDFNAPSHRDWTRPAVRARGLPYPIRWPVSLAMEDAGFVDSYRAVHPDPVADPGFSWTAGYPSPFVYEWEVHDRIDFVWAAGEATPVESLLVGESRRNADIVVDPYPSDHRGVVSEFEVIPAPAPVLVAAHRERSRLGAPLDVTFHAPEEAGAHVALVERSTGEMAADLPVEAPDGTIAVDTSDLAQGTFDIVLRDGTGAELARDSVVLVADGQHPVLVLADDTPSVGQVLEVSWTFGPGNRSDWIGLFTAGGTAKDDPILAWRYAGGLVEGSISLGPGVRGSGGWPLAPGEYEVLLCLDDSYRCRTSAPLTVVA